ncbi:class I SAM-dependent methyltransferase [Lipingzhangella sp. LS1_29]|uniref:Class I SAM-dependent methyltransferase n=1 Tax=Lipingzhangella rawalii TaxID=2055835 RepID=A0ABU2HC84_9ACTN|nr:class I SAM-dependent methyltransferase [Lipingzhangella rawalii]MDS1272194.1 class I SAM-dependent methyltransferase [Lipingzhangella rawalii]
MGDVAERPEQFRATLGRSVRLFSAFRREQTDPDHFYGTLARDTVAQLRGYCELAGAQVLDVGGGPGYFAAELRAAGARCVCVDADAEELTARDGTAPGAAVLGSALQLPVRTSQVDVCFSSNVLEHVPDPHTMAEEMVRVTRPGGVVYLSYTVWWSPWGGHETSPWHYLGGDFAARRFERRTGRPPKNRYGSTMFAVSVAEALRWARATPNADIVDIQPRYHPWWMRPVVRIPGLREIVTWNLLLVLRKRHPD